jgi:sugar-specific transcriptional regulator TrmB
MEERINKVLESIGLNKNEIKIYVDLIGHNESSALEISKRTKIHRSNTYDAIRKLMERGFIKEVIEEKKRFFKAVEPEKIRDYIKQQQNEVDVILPYLKGMTCQTPDKEEVSVARGVFSVRESLNDLLAQREPIYVLGASVESVETLGLGFLKEFHASRIKRKIIMKHIYNQNAQERIKKLNTMKLTEAKAFPNNFYSIVSTNICADYTMFLFFTNPVLAIKIRNKNLSESYRNYFEILWKQAKR